MFKALRTAHILGRGLLSESTRVSRLNYRVGLRDCDFNRHLTNSRYPVYLDLGRWDVMVRSGALSLCVRQRLTPVVVELSLKFKRELVFNTPFTLDTRLLDVDRRVITFEQVFLVDEEIYCQAEVRSLVLQGGRVVDAYPFEAFITTQLVHPS